MICENGHYKGGSRCKICEPPIEKKPKKGINKVSLTNKVRLTDGSKILRSELNNRINKAKAKLTEKAKKDKAEKCWSCNEKNDFLSWSHVISVRECINDGKSDFSYNPINMNLECMKCHPETELRKMDSHINKAEKEKVIEIYKNS